MLNILLESSWSDETAKPFTTNIVEYCLVRPYMTENKAKMEKAFELLIKEIGTHTDVVEEATNIFSKIEKNKSVTEEFVTLLGKTNYLKNIRGTLRRFNQSDLHIIVGQLGNLKTVLDYIKSLKEEKERIEKLEKLQKS